MKKIKGLKRSKSAAEMRKTLKLKPADQYKIHKLLKGENIEPLLKPQLTSKEKELFDKIQEHREKTKDINIGQY